MSVLEALQSCMLIVSDPVDSHYCDLVECNAVKSLGTNLQKFLGIFLKIFDVIPKSATSWVFLSSVFKSIYESRLNTSLVYTVDT